MSAGAPTDPLSADGAHAASVPLDDAVRLDHEAVDGVPHDVSRGATAPAGPGVHHGDAGHDGAPGATAAAPGAEDPAAP
ncbi:hypothetical protein AB0L40_27820, partial [Patulibacter sp. NPDC049589]